MSHQSWFAANFCGWQPQCVNMLTFLVQQNTLYYYWTTVCYNQPRFLCNVFTVVNYINLYCMKKINTFLVIFKAWSKFNALWTTHYITLPLRTLVLSLLYIISIIIHNLRHNFKIGFVHLPPVMSFPLSTLTTHTSSIYSEHYSS